VVGQEGSTSGSTTSIDPSTTVASSSTTIGSSSTSASTTSTVTSATTNDPSDADSSTSGETDVTFIADPSAGDLDVTCDEWAQDCPEGEKCMPWANDGSNSWNSSRCSPIAEMPHVPGEPCTVDGSAVSGIDDCVLRSMCWNVDPETNTGTCVAFCTGSEANPSCKDDANHCVIANDGVLFLCLPCCDPRMADCNDGQRCLPITDGFACTPDGTLGESGIGEACTYVDDCSAGACLPGANVPGCMDAGCCSPWCTVGDDASCEAALPGTVCTPWSAAQPTGCGDVDLGYCALPM
jgi:hypothetical protein